jgi:hypothetical protein
MVYITLSKVLENLELLHLYVSVHAFAFEIRRKRVQIPVDFSISHQSKIVLFKEFTFSSRKFAHLRMS